MTFDHRYLLVCPMQYLTAVLARGACHSRVFTVLDMEMGRVMMFTMTHVKTDHFIIGQHIYS